MIPRFEEIRVQALRMLKSGAVMRAKDFRNPLAIHFRLTEQDMNAEYPSGNGNIFADRISWALSYLFIAGLVDKPRRGDNRINTKGITDQRVREKCGTDQDCQKRNRFGRDTLFLERYCPNVRRTHAAGESVEFIRKHQAVRFFGDSENHSE